MKQKDPQLIMEQEKTQLIREQSATQHADNTDESVALPIPEERQDLLKWQQDLADELEILVHALRGESWNGDKWVKRDDVDALMNERGIRMVLDLCRPFMSRNMINSNFDENFVYGILRRTADTLVNNITSYGEEYEMKFGNYSYIKRLILNVIIPAPFRALNDGERKHARTISKRLESFAETGQRDPPKKGVMSMFT